MSRKANSIRILPWAIAFICLICAMWSYCSNSRCRDERAVYTRLVDEFRSIEFLTLVHERVPHALSNQAPTPVTTLRGCFKSQIYTLRAEKQHDREIVQAFGEVSEEIVKKYGLIYRGSNGPPDFENWPVLSFRVGYRSEYRKGDIETCLIRKNDETIIVIVRLSEFPRE